VINDFVKSINGWHFKFAWPVHREFPAHIIEEGYLIQIGIAKLPIGGKIFSEAKKMRGTKRAPLYQAGDRWKVGIFIVRFPEWMIYVRDIGSNILFG
jgi:hypothetical protein